MARRASAARVKSNRSYTVEEAAYAVGVTERTVRAWIKRGLAAMTSQRPALILGYNLKEFVAERRVQKAGPMEIGRFFCLTCKRPRPSALGMVDYQPLSERHGRLTALCADCEGTCVRIVSAASLPGWRRICQLGGNIPRRAYQNPSTETETITSEATGDQAEIQ